MPSIVEAKKMTFVWEHLSLQSGFCTSDFFPEDCLTDWEKFYPDRVPGFHHRVSSRFKCLSHDHKGTSTELGLMSFSGYFHPSKLDWDVQDCKISFHELSVLNDFKVSLFKYYERFSLKEGVCVQKISSTDKERCDSPFLQLCNASIVNLSRAKNRLQAAKDGIFKRKMDQNKELTDSKREVERLNHLLFQSELQRLVALSLVSHEMNGVLRVCSTTISGQRIVSVTSFSEYYVVLRKSHLILFQDSTHVSSITKFLFDKVSSSTIAQLMTILCFLSHSGSTACCGFSRWGSTSNNFWIWT
jgi:hypothetical protein